VIKQIPVKIGRETQERPPPDHGSHNEGPLMLEGDVEGSDDDEPIKSWRKKNRKVSLLEESDSEDSLGRHLPGPSLQAPARSLKNSKGSLLEDSESDSEVLGVYEQERLKKIQENQAVFTKLGL
jgi:hypothetical protein